MTLPGQVKQDQDVFKSQKSKKILRRVEVETLDISDIRKISAFPAKYSLNNYCFLKIYSTFAIRN
jgi:hypothetical protein